MTQWEAMDDHAFRHRCSLPGLRPPGPRDGMLPAGAPQPYLLGGTRADGDLHLHIRAEDVSAFGGGGRSTVVNSRKRKERDGSIYVS